MGKGVSVFVIIIVLVIVGYFLFNGGEDSRGVSNAEGGDLAGDSLSIAVPAPGQEDVEERIVDEGGDADDGGGLNVISITSNGFAPATLEIRMGGSVSFINHDVRSHWPATDIHPTHRAYPDSAIGKCNSEERNQIFDACKGLQRGESYSFQFNEVGNWNYHDHLRPAWTGTIVVR